jgi:hypothetical protein
LASAGTGIVNPIYPKSVSEAFVRLTETSEGEAPSVLATRILRIIVLSDEEVRMVASLSEIFLALWLKKVAITYYVDYQRIIKL